MPLLVSMHPISSGGSRGLRASLKQRSDSQELCVNVDLYRAIEALNLKKSGGNCGLSFVRYFCGGSNCSFQNFCPLPIIASENAHYFGGSHGKQLLDSKYLSSTNHKLQRRILILAGATVRFLPVVSRCWNQLRIERIRGKSCRSAVD